MRNYTSKQLGDACEMLVAAEITLAGVPTLKMPDMWPHYDLIAQPKDAATPLRISVKARTFKRGSAFVTYNVEDQFDWLAIVLLECEEGERRRVFLVPHEESNKRAKKDGANAKTNEWYYRIDKVEELLGEYKSNFSLKRFPRVDLLDIGATT